MITGNRAKEIRTQIRTASRLAIEAKAKASNNSSGSKEHEFYTQKAAEYANLAAELKRYIRTGISSLELPLEIDEVLPEPSPVVVDAPGQEPETNESATSFFSRAKAKILSLLSPTKANR